MELRRLGPEHRSELAEFPCSQFRQPWSEDIEWLVREQLADSLARGESKAMGLWKGDVLCAVVGWKEESPSEWHSVVTAVRTGHVGHGLGQRLKDELLALASAEGSNSSYHGFTEITQR